MQYLYVQFGSWPTIKYYSKISKLTRAEKEFVRVEMAALFKVIDGNICQIGLNGKQK